MSRRPVVLLPTLLCLAAVACERAAPPAAAGTAVEIEAARKVAQAFRTALENELKLAIETGGPAAAIGVCKERAPQIAAATATAEFSVRRIGTRVRNKRSNTPTAAERDVLARFQDLPPTERAQAHVETHSGGHLSVYLPIFIPDGRCLLCHGAAESLAADVRQKLAELYPDDEATGYAVGDLRGALVVERRR